MEMQDREEEEEDGAGGPTLDHPDDVDSYIDPGLFLETSFHHFPSVVLSGPIVTRHLMLTVSKPLQELLTSVKENNDGKSMWHHDYFSDTNAHVHNGTPTVKKMIEGNLAALDYSDVKTLSERVVLESISVINVSSTAPFPMDLQLISRSETNQPTELLKPTMWSPTCESIAVFTPPSGAFYSSTGNDGNGLQEAQFVNGMEPSMKANLASVNFLDQYRHLQANKQNDAITGMSYSVIADYPDQPPTLLVLLAREAVNKHIGSVTTEKLAKKNYAEAATYAATKQSGESDSKNQTTTKKNIKVSYYRVPTVYMEGALSSLESSMFSSMTILRPDQLCLGMRPVRENGWKSVEMEAQQLSATTPSCRYNPRITATMTIQLVYQVISGEDKNNTANG